ncbi:MAG: hypothetical protein U1E46_16310 [Hyphomicrobiales bacterium]
MRMFSLIVIAGLVGSAATAQAFEIKPIQSAQIELGNVEGVAYFDMVGSKCRLVATVAQQDGTPIQVTAMLDQNEELTISVPGPVGYPAQEVGFTRKGDVVEVSAPPPEAGN